jgi:hypothetical protein
MLYGSPKGMTCLERFSIGVSKLDFFVFEDLSIVKHPEAKSTVIEGGKHEDFDNKTIQGLIIHDWWLSIRVCYKQTLCNI